MSMIIIYISLVLVGLCMGSFAGATVWRLRALELKADKAAGLKVDKSEYNRLSQLAKVKLADDHSRCLSCSYFLKWYDLIPLVSWLTLGGKCRKCRKPIGYLEPMIELGVMLFFVLSFLFWPNPLTNYTSIAVFGLWLLAGVGLAILFVYDMKWFILPDVVNFAVVGVGAINAILILFSSQDLVRSALNIAGSVFVLFGIYLILYLVSKGRWIGFGDVKLGLGLGLILADWKLAFIALFAANLIGCILVVPLMIIGKLKRDSKVPFGPMLIAGYVISGLFGVAMQYFVNIL